MEMCLGELCTCTRLSNHLKVTYFTSSQLKYNFYAICIKLGEQLGQYSHFIVIDSID